MFCYTKQKKMTFFWKKKTIDNDVILILNYYLNVNPQILDQPCQGDEGVATKKLCSRKQSDKKNEKNILDSFLYDMSADKQLRFHSLT
jgi:hypothetical protein